MPLYEYSCRRCRQRFEARLRYEERLAPQTCPSCGTRETSLCFSTPSLVGVSHRSSEPDGCRAENGACGCGRFPATA